MTVDRRYLDYGKVLQIKRLLRSGMSQRRTAAIAGVDRGTVAKIKAEMESDQ